MKFDFIKLIKLSLVINDDNKRKIFALVSSGRTMRIKCTHLVMVTNALNSSVNLGRANHKEITLSTNVIPTRHTKNFNSSLKRLIMNGRKKWLQQKRLAKLSRRMEIATLKYDMPRYITKSW